MRTNIFFLLTLIALVGCPAVSIAEQNKFAKVDPVVWQKVQTQGTIRVLVDLNIPGWVSKPLTKDAEIAQRKLIADTQRGTLAELAGTRHKVNRQYEIVPALALEIGPDALVILERSSRVVKVYEDAGIAPYIEIDGIKKIPDRDKPSK